MKLAVLLPRDRTKEGTAAAAMDTPGVVHRFRVLGRSDSKGAADHGNPTRDPLKPYGDLPTGTYTAVRTVAAKPATAANIRSYGPNVRYVLNPTGGQALLALKAGRFAILLHGGATGSPMPPGALRPTFGCLRADDKELAWLAKNAPATFPVTVAEV